MNISIITVGKLKEKIFKARHSRIHKTITSLRKKSRSLSSRTKKAPENLSDQDMKIIKDKEANERILSKINPDAHVIALAIEGKMKTSEELADTIDKLATYGKKQSMFCYRRIPLGLSDAVMQRANE
ncbi:ribosomal RNA large subunit methyltransferase H [Bacillus safensis]|uniref:Ribosomal RNA large subunit methyltransferase H n=1 Tax=Bacillus safensis TaxID=561879 RepID=A0A5S9MK20_BACIA|nr:ribosomal RNA large subunit methyltransferase H [Bacillus safensis]